MRQCDHWPIGNPLSVHRQQEKNRRVVKYAEMIGEGASANAVGRAHGSSGDQVRSMMASACPPFLPVRTEVPIMRPLSYKPTPAAPERPFWTRPGSTLLQAAHEARAEIEASGWFGRRRDDHAE